MATLTCLLVKIESDYVFHNENVEDKIILTKQDYSTPDEHDFFGSSFFFGLWKHARQREHESTH